MHYTCNDIFMVRTPSLPVNIFSEFISSGGHSIEDFIQQHNLGDFMDKSILIASRDLYRAKERNLQHNSKKIKSREISLIKFLIRASTRPTPYGFFAGVALGEFCDDTGRKETLIVDEKKAVIECSVDHAWLSHLIYEFENNSAVYPQLKIRFNNNCYVSGDRLKNPHYSNHGFAARGSTVVNRNHVRNTPLIGYIKQEAKTFLEYNSLKSKIQSKYPNVSEKKIVSTINMLMENEILLTNLRAPSNCSDGLEYILKILEPIEGIEAQKQALQQVNVLINQVSSEQEFQNVDAATIQSIYALQKGLLVESKEKDLLVANKGIALKHNRLPSAVKVTIENFVEGLTYLQIDSPSKLGSFKQRFLEEYGTHTEVSLCDIIDQNIFNGLSYLEKDQPFHSERDQKIRQIVDEKVLFCLQTQGEEVTFYQNDFSSLGTVFEDKLPESFDINFFVTKKEDRFNLSVAPAGGSGSAGNMFNRFGNVLDSKLFDQYKENNKSKRIFSPDTITVEIKEGSTLGRLNNINNRGNEHQYYIALATNDDHPEAIELTLDDLLIGMQNNRLYLKSKSQGKFCKIVHDCMINYKALSEITQFLLYVSSDYEMGLLPRLYNTFRYNYVFVPRILFEDVVIQPKGWNLPAQLFDLKTLSSFAQSLQTLRHKYHIDDIVYLTEHDNRLMLHLDKEYTLDILYKQIKKSEILTFNELEKNVLTDHVCFDASGNGYVSEISCSLMLSKEIKKSTVLSNQSEYELQNENRTLVLLQDGWIYAKLYNMVDRENEVLKHLSYFLNTIGNPKFFYLRYADDAGQPPILYIRIELEKHCIRPS